MFDLTFAGLPFPVIWEDASYFAVSKPARIHSVARPDSAAEDQKPEESIAGALAIIFPNLRDVGLKPEDSGLVQRLDFETSGVLLGAKTREAWNQLRAALAGSQVVKRYRVLLEGVLSEPQEIDAPIGSPYRRGTKVRVYLENRSQRGVKRSQPAKSTFSPIKAFPPKGCSLAMATTSNGRRHQVRAHAAALGFPLCGDALYGSKHLLSDFLGRSVEDPSMPQFLLHAEEVNFIHPLKDKEMAVSAEVPSYFRLPA